jgi:hypothetical protein
MPSNLCVNCWKNTGVASVWLDKPEHAAGLHPPGSACPNQYHVVTSAACKKQTLVLSTHDTRPPPPPSIMGCNLVQIWSFGGEDVRCP